MKSTSCPRLFLLLALVFFTSGASGLYAQTRTVTRVAAVGTASYFVLDDGALYEAGSSFRGNVGGPRSISTGVKEVFAGPQSVFFLKTDGTLWALGSNNSGEFGNGTQTRADQPIQVAADVVSVAPGSNHTLFLKADATLWAAGSNDRGQLGTGQTGSRPSLTPIQVASEVRAIAAGQQSSFFIKTDGSLWGMGYNPYGAFGIGQNSGSTDYASPLKLGSNASTISVIFYTAVRISILRAIWLRYKYFWSTRSYPRLCFL